jgi:hypothetical protein
MITKTKQMQRLIRLYKEETGAREVNMNDVAAYAHKKGWPLPKPVDPLEALAKQFSQAAREEIRHDRVTGKPYRANHAITTRTVIGHQFTLWVDIDEIGRKPMLKSLVQRREQMVGDGLHLSFDIDHWNRIHPREDPINLSLDLTPDVRWRRNAPDEDGKAA